MSIKLRYKMIIDENKLSRLYHVVDMKLCRILHKLVCLSVPNNAYQILCLYWIIYKFLCGNLLLCIFEYFSFVTKGRYLKYISIKQKYLKYIPLWPQTFGLCQSPPQFITFTGGVGSIYCIIFQVSWSFPEVIMGSQSIFQKCIK